MLPLRYESSGSVRSPMEQVFAHLDDHTRLSSHMSERSWRTGGGRMETDIDEGRGPTVGSRIRPSGRVFGVELSVEEIVVERAPARWLERLFGRYYARWCTQQMVDDAVNHFEAWPGTKLPN